jgi:hypothetical protein
VVRTTGEVFRMDLDDVSEALVEAAEPATAYMDREATDLSSGHNLEATSQDPPAHTDKDSTYEDSSGDSYQSQTPTPSIMLGQEQNGRWYATYGEHFYPPPN